MTSKIHVKLKMSALWASVMFIYADYFGLYVPGSLQRVLAGKMGPLGSVTQMVLLGTSVTLAIPSVMIFLSLVLKPNFQSVAEYRLGRALYRDYPHHDVEMGILYILWSHRDLADGTRGLVCMELAQA